MISVKVTDGHHFRVEFKTPTIPGVGDVLTIVKSKTVADCYTVTGRAFLIESFPEVDQATVESVTLKVRKSTSVEEMSFQRR